MSNNLKQNLTNFIKNNNVNIRALERKYGIPQTLINSIIHETSKNPGINNVIKIAEAMNCSIDELVGRNKLAQTKLEISEVPYNHEVFKSCINHLLSLLDRHDSKTIHSDIIIHSIIECYNYSLENNLKSVDEKFANWIFKNNILPKI